MLWWNTRQMLWRNGLCRVHGVATARVIGALPERLSSARTCIEAQHPAGRQALLHRAATGRPFSVLKYAMTADGKIATCAGHAAWVSSPASRQLVFEARARSDAIVVGGNTVRAAQPGVTQLHGAEQVPGQEHG